MKNILVALDLEYESLTRDMLAQAEQLAKAFNAKCWLLHVARKEPEFIAQGIEPQYIKEMLEEDKKEIHKRIQGYADELSINGIDIECLIINGPTSEVIKNEIKKLSIDMLILGNKKHSFIFNLFIGSTTNELIDYINVPVLLIPEKE